MLARLLRWSPVLAVVVLTPLPSAPSDATGYPRVQANDNRQPAGRLQGDTLRISLVVGMAEWYPEAEDGPHVSLAAFSEAGRAPQIPGPLIRVPAGTVIKATVRNGLPDSTLTVHGLHSRPAVTGDSLVIPPGGSAGTTFTAGAPGTYLYYAVAGAPDTMVEREQLAGAFVVDSAGAARDDRIFVINIWGDPIDSINYRNALAINGKSFPWDERITATLGDSVRWRWINASIRNHPMHLHGFFFRIDAEGDWLSDTVYAPADRRMAVTENMIPGATMDIVWSPDRIGNWLFHCHIGFHVVPDAQLDPPPPGGHAHYSGKVGQHMAGLVLGITVRPPPGWREAEAPARQQERLYVQEGRPHGKAPRAMGFVLQRGNSPPAPDSVDIPGAALILHRGVPADIMVINRMREATTVHWHGLELESYSDGVAGWSGMGEKVAPVIAPGDSFVAHLTLQRAGTFIYHTHLNDYEQLTSGLYGPIVVLEPGERFNPDIDHVFTAGWDGPDDPPSIVVNGDPDPGPLMLAAGRTHRMRFVNMGMAVRLRFAIYRDSSLSTWRAIAKDGADLPAWQARPGPSWLEISVGETADAAFTPPEAGEYRLEARAGSHVFWSRKLVVHR
ncbi:MAG: multicopper oxidase domain-containing protein [Gemmatimonadales bacterium]